MKLQFATLLRYVAFTLCALSVTTVANAAPKVGERFGDWEFGCTAIAEGKTVCAVTQTLIVKKENKHIAKFTVARNEKKGALVLSAVLPLGIHLPSGVSGAIDQGRAFQYTVEACVPQGCIATHPIDASLLKSMKAGQKLSINFNFIAGKKPISIAGSLNGLTEALKAANLD